MIKGLGFEFGLIGVESGRIRWPLDSAPDSCADAWEDAREDAREEAGTFLEDSWRILGGFLEDSWRILKEFSWILKRFFGIFGFLRIPRDSLRFFEIL